ncbi:bifunctional 3-(3-hydroxy-phenyl)propionate/3-hydroxycinnamic acid hydroxylase [Streptomyces sp. cmx-18-6]|uniref:bifunctional 3-(3-hydroxy-phenyl)propionate/3-hydroxycinnamic acid hydroxylase MhpA n=1 Tax=Streptomyces sp. cmx-18-6 TaxID=2790930 RepID=UPI0039813142
MTATPPSATPPPAGTSASPSAAPPRAEAPAPAADVIVVGYGPVGQVTALLLAARGWQVTVVERWPAPYPMPRAVSFDGESARILAAAGVGDSLGQLGEPSGDYVWRNAAGQTLVHVDVAAAGHSGWPDSTSMYQPGLEAALAARGEELPGLRVLRGHRVTALQDHGTRVEVTVEGPQEAPADGPDGPDRPDAPRERGVSARWVVGCDGANSFVREAIGAPVTDFGFFNDWLTCDVRLHEPREFVPNNLQVCDPARPRTEVSAGPGHRRWEFMRLADEDPEEFGRPDNAWRLLGLFGIDRADATLERHAVYTFQARYVDAWRVGRVLLAGDAAHLMPPFAGQGMCSGFRDAANLAWKLDLVLGGRADERLLDTYTSERREHVRHALKMSMDLGRVICETDPAAARDRDTVMLAVRERGIATAPPRSAVQALTTGFLHRRDGDGLPAPAAGDLVPQAAVARADGAGPFDAVVGPGFALLTTAPPGELLDDERLAFLGRIGVSLVHLLPAGTPAAEVTAPAAVDVDGVYLRYLAEAGGGAGGRGGDVGGAVALLVRPDFYVFGAAPDRDALAALVDDLRAGLRSGALIG